MMNEIKNDDQNEVKIVVKTVIPSPPCYLTVPSNIKILRLVPLYAYNGLITVFAGINMVHDLRKLVAESKHVPIDSLGLISRGKALHDIDNGEEVYIQLADGDSFIAAIRPNAQPNHVSIEFNDNSSSSSDDDDLKFHLPESTSRWKRRLYYILHDKLKLPDIVLMAVFSLSLKTWVYIVLWFTLAPVAHRLDLGPLYILATGFVLIFKNLGRRRAGELSAYSIFNKDFRELPGTFNADRVDRDIRAGRI